MQVNHVDHKVENNIIQKSYWHFGLKKIHEIRQIKVLGVNCQENEVTLY